LEHFTDSKDISLRMERYIRERYIKYIGFNNGGGVIIEYERA
jgi:hypothetical protein